MEKYIITLEEKSEYLDKYPVFCCENSFGVDYDGYVSIQCKKLTGTCTYKNSIKEEYKNCKLLNKR